MLHPSFLFFPFLVVLSAFCLPSPGLWGQAQIRLTFPNAIRPSHCRRRHVSLRQNQAKGDSFPSGNGPPGKTRSYATSSIIFQPNYIVRSPEIASILFFGSVLAYFIRKTQLSESRTYSLPASTHVCCLWLSFSSFIPRQNGFSSPSYLSS